MQIFTYVHPCAISIFAIVFLIIAYALFFYPISASDGSLHTN